MKLRPRDPRPILEDKIQQAIVALLNFKADRRVLFYHIPNEGKRSAATAAWLKKMGMVSGAPDLGLVLPNGRAAFIEVKSENGRSGVAQELFQDACYKRSIPYAVVRSSEEAEQVLWAWGALRGPAPQQVRAA